MKKFAALFTCALLSLAVLPSCGSDNDDDTPDNPAATPLSFTGEIFSTIPQVPDFEGSLSDDTAVVTWEDNSLTKCTVTIGEFDVTIPQMNRSIHMGEMNITNCSVTKNSDGAYIINNSAFTCMSGDYETTGTLDGEISADGVFTVELNYKPGSMPMTVNSVFTSKK